jgi:serine/threonine protein kinase
MKSYHHPNVLPLYTSFVHGQDLWMVTPFMSGGSVLHIMKYRFPKVRSFLFGCRVLHSTIAGTPAKTSSSYGAAAAPRERCIIRCSCKRKGCYSAQLCSSFLVLSCGSSAVWQRQSSCCKSKGCHHGLCSCCVALLLLLLLLLLPPSGA